MFGSDKIIPWPVMILSRCIVDSRRTFEWFKVKQNCKVNRAMLCQRQGLWGWSMGVTKHCLASSAMKRSSVKEDADARNVALGTSFELYYMIRHAHYQYKVHYNKITLRWWSHSSSERKLKLAVFSSNPRVPTQKLRTYIAEALWFILFRSERSNLFEL